MQGVLMNRGDLSTEEWERLKPLIPPQKPRTGKPNHHHRQVVNGILWILRTGAAWRDLPERYGRWESIATRFYRWQKAGGRRIRNYLYRRGICLTIPRLSNEPRRGSFNREIYRQRNIVERAINRLKQFRPFATRYEKLAANYTAMITLACILLWL